MNESFEQLMVLYEAGELSGDRLDRFFELLEDEGNRALLARSIDQKVLDPSFSQVENKALTDEAVQRLKAAMQQAPAPVVSMERGRRRSYGWWAAAAVLIIGLGGYWMMVNKKISKTPADIVANTMAPDVKPPQSNRATITLSNGRRVCLDSAASGQLAMQGNVKIVKLADGKISYSGSATAMVYNTLSNPRGSRVVDMTLADGSRVWLNAGSSITYPVAFAGKERKVSITGEAYFEVAKASGKSFWVTANSTAIQVLGTHFNVDSYEDDGKVKTTLLEGSVRVAGLDESGHPLASGSIIIRPGQQAVYSLNSRQLSASDNIDMECVMAWKNGFFDFDNTSIKAILNQLSRWYDVEVVYEDGVPDIELGGEMKRDLTLSQVLKGLSKLGVNFKIEGKKLIVMP